MFYVFCFHLSVGEYLGWLHYLATVNWVPIDMDVQVSHMFTYTLSGMVNIGHMVDIFLYFQKPP